MEPMTWKQAFSIGYDLKKYREENNIAVPNEYLVSIKRNTVAFGIACSVLALFLGIWLGRNY